MQIQAHNNMSCCIVICVFDAECSNFTYGPGCQLRCRCSANHTSSCDHVTGTCLCVAGYQGAQCSQACAVGLYGPGCGEQCQCGNGARCDHVTGSCYCSPGWMGPECRHPCTPGTWGSNCEQV